MYEKLTQILEPDADAMHQNSDAPAVKATRDAAVLVPLVHHAQQWQILFIRRAHNERDRHSGQVAFPGGRVESTDASTEAAALRETREEVGIAASHVTVVGQIQPYVTVSSYQVTPVIGIVNWPTTLKLQSSEVARAFLIPLSWLRDRNNFTFRARQNMDPQGARRHPIIVFDPYDDEVLWGATARMTLNFIELKSTGRIVASRYYTELMAASILSTPFISVALGQAKFNLT